MNVFAYGTLMDPEIMRSVSGARYDQRAATLDGFVRKTVRGEVYPGILSREGYQVAGVVYLDVPASALDRLDAFEGPLYERTEVTAIDDQGRSVVAQTYVVVAGAVERLSEEDWSLDHFQRMHKQVFRSDYPGYRKL